MKEKIFKFFEKNKWIIIPLFFGGIFILNHPFFSYVAGGDSFPIFYTSQFIYDQLYVWTHTITYGAVGGQSFYVLLLPYVFVLDFLKNIFGDFLASYIYFGAIFILAPLGIYFLLRTLKFRKNTALLFGFFYGLNFLVWSALTRNVIPITNLFVFTPFIIGLLILFFETNHKKYLWILVFLNIFNIFIISNPWTFGIQGILILIFITKYFHKKNLKNIFLAFLSLYSFALPGIIVLFTMLFNSQNLVADDWNNVVLKGGAIAREMQESGVLNTLRGFNGDLFAFWGYIDYNISDNFYYPFLFSEFYKNIFIQFLSFLPLFLIIFGLIFFIKKDKKILFWFWIFIVSLFLFKGVGNPFGEAFYYCLNNIPICGIFRSPHQKFSIIFIIALIVLLALIREKFLNKKIKIAYDGVLLLYIFVMGSFLFSSSYISKMNILTNVPNEYKISAENINQNENIKNIIVLPFNESTWTNTEFGFEGYSLFSYLLPQKQIYNRNDLAFSDYAKNIHNILGPALRDREENIVDLMNVYNIDTIIYDAYTDRYTRFAHKEEHVENLKFLDSQKGLQKIGTFGKIHIYHKDSRPLLIGDEISYIKNNSTNYSVNIKNLKKETLVFLQSYHKDWKIYLEKHEEDFCEGFEKKGKIFPETIKYEVKENDTLEKFAKIFNIEAVDIQNANKLSNLKELKVGDFLQIPRKSSEKDYLIYECDEENKFNLMDFARIFNKSIFEDSHKIVYNYANSWEIDANYIKNNFPKKFYKENEDGSIDVKLTLYFKPQSYFYLGLLFSLSIFVILIFYLTFSFFINRKK